MATIDVFPVLAVEFSEVAKLLIVATEIPSLGAPPYARTPLTLRCHQTWLAGNWTTYW